MLKTVSSATNAIGALNFKGTWNAATNTPTIVSGVGVKGDYFVVGVAGSTTIDGISNWGVGDWIAYNGSVWQRVEGGADLNGVNLSVSGTTTLSNLTASTALALNASKEVLSVTNTGTGNNVLATSPTLVTPSLGTATFDAGTVGAPSITTTGDTNTGVYFPAADTIAFSQGGAEGMRISNGDLSVGAASDPIGVSRFAAVVAGANRSAATFKNDDDTFATINVHNADTAGDNIFLFFATETALTGRGSISFNRGAGLTAYNTTSDYRAKDITGPVTDSGALIDSVPVYMGKMKDATQERPMFIAHEVPAYAHTGEKDAVDKDGNPVYQQMDASALIPVMWAEIQSLRARISALESN